MILILITMENSNMAAADAKYPAHLKKVLKTYQRSAIKSLQGPNTVLVEDNNSILILPITAADIKTEQSSELLSEHQRPSSVPLQQCQQQQQQVPILSTADQLAELSETLIEGHKISCFIIGGEKRICFVQLLSTVLRKVNATTINNVCTELFINFSTCNSDQLLALKAKGLLPPETPTCGLVTKPDAERLCSVLLHEGALPPFNMEKYSNFSFLVYHECFNGAKGIIYVDLYTEKNWCVQCVICRRFFTPQMFVCHSCYLDKKRNTIHTYIEPGICHWGFDSTNWRLYLLVVEEQPDYEKCNKIMDVFKDQHKGSTAIMLPVKRKQIQSDPHRNNGAINVISRNHINTNNNNSHSNNTNNNNSNNNNNNSENNNSIPGGHHISSSNYNHNNINSSAVIKSPVMSDQTASVNDDDEKYIAKKKARMMMMMEENEQSALNNAEQPSEGYYGSFHTYYNNLCESWVRNAAAAGYHPPWPPYSIAATYSKDAKSQAYYFTDGVPPPFLAQGPPVLLHPERVVSLSQSEQFERSYQPNVSLAPSQSKYSSEDLLSGKVKRSVIRMKSDECDENVDKPYSSGSLVDVEERSPTASPITTHHGQIICSPPASPSNEPAPDNGINSVVEQVAAVLDALSDAEDAVRQRVINLVERLTTRIDKSDMERLRFREEIVQLRAQLAELRQENMQLFYDNNQLRQQLDKLNYGNQNNSAGQVCTTPRQQHCSPVSVITSPSPKVEPIAS